jgi:hypothetical protein
MGEIHMVVMKESVNVHGSASAAEHATAALRKSPQISSKDRAGEIGVA